MNMNKNNNDLTQETVDERILAELKAENMALARERSEITKDCNIERKFFVRADSEILKELQAENLLLSLQNENEQLRMEIAKMN